jgi:SNF family Na+-dependent transporter
LSKTTWATFGGIINSNGGQRFAGLFVLARAFMASKLMLAEASPGATGADAVQAFRDKAAQLLALA